MSEEQARIREYGAPGIVITWEPGRCQHSTNCVRGLPQVFDNQARPWIDPTGAGVEDIVSTIDRCPSFALGYRTEDGRTRTAPSE
ncbi:MAG: (4Fe-4S)-binding protein [Nocardioidaceae bacterium]|nr:(4Fe-4S)-binding protein [Nocardioidaceae bacterium]